jgi:hypothetical protein
MGRRQAGLSGSRRERGASRLTAGRSCRFLPTVVVPARDLACWQLPRAAGQSPPAGCSRCGGCRTAGSHWSCRRLARPHPGQHCPTAWVGSFPPDVVVDVASPLVALRSVLPRCGPRQVGLAPPLAPARLTSSRRPRRPAWGGRVGACHAPGWPRGGKVRRGSDRLRGHRTSGTGCTAERRGRHRRARNDGARLGSFRDAVSALFDRDGSVVATCTSSPTRSPTGCSAGRTWRYAR